ncbi:MAG: glucose-1-phosphate cytidylyltransferase [Pseudomonadota bacterium]
MKAVILAGGLGTRISEETQSKPKPMIEIGGKPILWHIMKTYSHYGIYDFVICLGYKGYAIKEYFANYFLHSSDVTFHMAEDRVEILAQRAEPWTVTLIDTGKETMTGGRLKRVAHLLKNDTFCVTYGDGVADIDINSLLRSHRDSGKLATVTAVSPPGRFGALKINNDNSVEEFTEKPHGDGDLINGGYFVMEPGVLDLISGDDSVLETGPMCELVVQNQLNAYPHDGFWQPVDTLREMNYLETLHQTGEAKWMVWE